MPQTKQKLNRLRSYGNKLGTQRGNLVFVPDLLDILVVPFKVQPRSVILPVMVSSIP